MGVKVYISGISGNKEVKKRQQRVLMILESKGIPCDVVDITEPGRETDKEFMQKNSKTVEEQRNPLPPQIFNDDVYCGDYDEFDLCNENDELEKFLKVPVNPARAEKQAAAAAAAAAAVGNGTENGVSGSREASAERVVESTEDASSKTGEAQGSEEQTPAESEQPEEEGEEGEE